MYVHADMYLVETKLQQIKKKLSRLAECNEREEKKNYVR